jgi:hypothetical protein
MKRFNANIFAIEESPWSVSLIISDLLAIIDDFGRTACASVVRQLGRFAAGDFSSRCDGHANTLTLIGDTDRNIFSGFASVNGDSSGSFKVDRSLRLFLFRLKNRHNIPTRRFVLKIGERDRSIVRTYQSCQR